MRQLLLCSGLALELAVAFWPISLIVVSTVDTLTFSELYLVSAETALPLTAVSVVLTALGMLLQGNVAFANRRVLVALSWLGILGTLFSAWWITDIDLWASTDCTPLAPWKCNLVQAHTYFSYYFFPAIAVPIVTLIYVSRIRLPTSSD